MYSSWLEDCECDWYFYVMEIRFMSSAKVYSVFKRPSHADPHVKRILE